MKDTLYLCIKQFNSRLGDELNLKVGDKIEVLSDDSEYNDGWYMGKNLSNNEVGLYPKSFTQVLVNEPTEHPSLLRSRSRSRGIPSPNPNSPNTTPSKISQLTNTFENLSMKNSPNEIKKQKSKPSADNGAADLNGSVDPPNDQAVHKTMSDIDRALQELQSDSFVNNSDHSVTQELPVKSPDHNGKSHQRTASNLSLTEDLNPKDAMKWTPKQVTSYFALGLGFDASVAGKFARHKITGAILFELDLAHLKELDIDSFGTRFEIHKEIENLKKIVNGHEKQILDENGLAGLQPPHHPSQPQTPSSQIGSSSPGSPFNDNSNDTTNDSIENQNPYGHSRKMSHSMENVNDMVTPIQNSHNRDNNLDKNFKFGEQKGNNDVYKNKYGSTSALTGTPGAGASRPASSIYDQSVHSRNHSRNMSNMSDYQQPGGHMRTQSRTQAHSRNPSGVNNHRRHSSIMAQGNDNKNDPHRRHSSMFSFMSKGEDIDNKKYYDKKQDKLISPVKIKHSNPNLQSEPGEEEEEDFTGDKTPGQYDESVDIDHVQFSPRKSKSINYKYDEPKKLDFKDDKRSVSDSANLTHEGNSSNPSSNSTTPKNSASISRFKTLRTASTNNFKNLTSSKKSKTSAFQEGIRSITPDEAIKTANYSGFMAKRSGSNLSWRSRYFTLHGTRLSYFTSLKDKKEKGLIDITAHKVIPINTEGEDKYVALYAASTGLGRYCFKLIPPAPGFKKGLTFTQPKTHFFAVESQDEMRGWMKALMTSTIDIDDSVPVVSSCSTPTVTLAKAQELLAKAREETKLKDEEIKAKGFLGDFNNFGGDDDFSEAQLTSFIGNYTLDPNSSGENSPIVESVEEASNMSSNPYSSSNATPNIGTGTSGTSSAAGFTTIPHNDPYGAGPNATTGQPKLSIDTSGRPSSRGPTTPQANNSQGFASPYLLASGLLSPRSNSGVSPSIPAPAPAEDHDDTAHSANGTTTTNGSNYSNSNSHMAHTNMTNVSTPLEQGREYFPEFESNESTPKSLFSNGRTSTSNNTTTQSQSQPQHQSHSHQYNPIKKKRNSEKMLAYSSDGSGNHTFVIQPKK